MRVAAAAASPLRPPPPQSAQPPAAFAAHPAAALALSGAAGAAGAAGAKGDKGDTGAAGAAGATGPQGPAGAAGGIAWVSVPSSPTASGTAGDLARDSSYLYACTATNTWRRTPLSSWNTFLPIPVMTADTTPSGWAFDSGALNTGLEGWHAFDKDSVVDDSSFYASPSPASGNWVQYGFNPYVASKIGGYAITTRLGYGYGNSSSASSQAPVSWTFSGGNEFNVFTTLDTRTGQTFTEGQTRTFTLASPAEYRFYRWTWTANPTGGPVVIPKLQLVAAGS
jgi:hypothetical protein